MKEKKKEKLVRPNPALLAVRHSAFN